MLQYNSAHLVVSLVSLQSGLDQLLPYRLQFLPNPFQLAYLISSDQEVVQIHVPIHVLAYLQALPKSNVNQFVLTIHQLMEKESLC